VAELADAHALGACRTKSCAGSIPVFGTNNIKYIQMKIFSPFQKVLLEKHLCVGCTYPLDKAKKIGDISDTKYIVECKCKRRFVYDRELNTYRRLTLQEEQQYLNK
jgi:hypothetical protein